MSRPKIVVTRDFILSEVQKTRLKSLGDTTFHSAQPDTTELWIERVKDADVICAGIFGFKQKWPEL